MSLPLAFISLVHLGSIILLVLGFGFVIFWHELGHFLAAKAVGIRVEQFAVGFGHAVVSWRKGIGFRVGNTQKDYRARAEKHLLERRRATPDEKPDFSDSEIATAADELKLGETEYRLNWIPLGGYVKMLGQDDLKPDAIAEDPKAYNKKSIPARMLVISAGVVMNILLAAIGFMILFRIGFHVQPAWVGNVVPGSPAQKAGLITGDRIRTYNGKEEADATKLTLDIALSSLNQPVTMEIDRPLDEKGTRFERKTILVTPARGKENLLQLGFSFPPSLDAPKAGEVEMEDDATLAKEFPPEATLLKPDDKVIAVNGTPVDTKDFVLFHRMVQESFGKPLKLTIVRASKKEESAELQPHLEDTLFNGPFNLAGMIPRASITVIQTKSPLLDKGKPGDVVVALHDADELRNPSKEMLVDRLGKLGESGKPFSLTLLRDGKELTINDLRATVSLGENRKGLGIGPGIDETHTVIADLVPDDSPAKAAGLHVGDEVTALDGTPVSTWFDVQRIVSQLPAPEKGKTASIDVTYKRPTIDGPQHATMTLSADQLAAVHDVQYTTRYVQFADYPFIRQTSNPGDAARWGVTETRDFIPQFYLTLRRMVTGEVPASSMMGPLGIFATGKRMAYRGTDWLIWFLAMISANLAVVNFLPIPVVDGGQFMFLIFEKIKGRPLSTRAMLIAQYSGLAFLAAVVIFVTYHDLLRHY